MNNLLYFPQQYFDNPASSYDDCDGGKSLQLVEPSEKKKFIPTRTVGAANALRTPEEVQALKDYFLTKVNKNGRKAFNERNYALVVLGLNCGKRIGDMLEFKLRDVLDENGNIKDAIYLKEDKSKKPARVKITTVIKEALRNYIDSERLNDSYEEFLFKSRQKNRRTGTRDAITTRRVNQMLKEAKAVIGLQGKITSHTMRKTFARTLIINNKYDMMIIAYVQKLLNHSSPKETLIYCDIMNDELDDLLENNPI